MADRKISELSRLSGADVNANDFAAVADVSANETRKVTIKDLAEAGYRVSGDGSIPISKVELLPNTIDGNVIKDDSLGAQQIAPDSITSSELGDGAVDTAAIQDLAVTTEKLADGIDGAKLADKSVKTDQIGDNAVTIGQLGLSNNELDGAVLQDDSVTNTQIAPETIGTTELANDAVSTEKIQDLAVTTEKLADDIDGAKLADKSVKTEQIGDNAVTIGQLGLGNNELDGAVLQDDSVTEKQIAPDAIGTSELANDSVSTDKIQDLAVTTQKLADNIDAVKLADGTVTTSKIADQAITNGKIADATIEGGKIALGTITGSNIAGNTINADHIAADAIGSSELADGAVDTPSLQDQAVTGPKLNPDAFNRGLGQDADGRVGIINSITPGAHAGITYDGQGLITSTTTPIPTSDLPIATEDVIGAVSIPVDGGLTVNAAGAVRIDNTIAPGEGYKISYNDHGLVTGSGDIEPADLPIATSTTLGAVMVPNIDGAGDEAPISVDGTGALKHDETSFGSGVFPKIEFDKYGHVIGGTTLDATDIPEISADLITSGEIGSELLGECSVTAPKICDYATCLMQEDNPGAGDFLGQFWYTPSTAQLRVYARGSGPENIWLPVGFGALQANNLRWGGTYDADTDTVVSLTAIGISEGLTAGQPFPPPSDQKSGLYFICQTPGNSMVQPNLNGINHTAGDWALCIDAAQGWIHIDANASSGGGGGSAQYLNDLLDVEIGGTASPFSTAPAVALSSDHLLRYDGGAGLWRNTDIIDGGSID